MTIKYFANRVRETSTTNGNGSLVLSGASSGYKTVLSSIGTDKRFTYYIYRTDSVFEWEIGVGYIVNNSGVILLNRERAISSSNNNNLVSFTTGSKLVETIVSEDRVNTSFLNVEAKTGNFTADYIPATYVIDASSSNVQVNLPEVSSYEDSVVLGFVLNKTIGDQYSQPNAIVLVPSGTETISGASSYDMSVRNDYLEIMSMPAQSGWVLLDPIQDSSNPYGNDGSVQVKYDNAFSGVVGLNWDFNSSALLIGGTGNAVTADIILPSGSNSTVVFNEQSLANDLRVEGSGSTHLLFIDGSENKIAINSTNAYDSLTINSQYGNGLTIHRSGVGPQITIGNTSVSGLATNDIIGSIAFSGLNNSGNPIVYSKIYSTIENTDDANESSNINMEIVKNGSFESVAQFGASGVTIGFNNTNLDGILIGEISQNEGNNVVLGYYQNICGENCVAIGHNSSLASGTFGGLIGLDHSSSGNNIWIIGGSGVSVTGDNRTYLAVNNNNYATLDNSGNFNYIAFTSGNQNFNVFNTYSLTSGINQQLNFKFKSSTGVERTGLVIGSQIIDPTNTSEDSQFFAKILSGGSAVEVAKISNNNVAIGNSSVSGNNISVAIDSNISGINNSIFGYSIANSGNNNIIFGKDISHSGDNTTIFGRNITCATSGNVGITIFGSNNTADEDYTCVFGNNNSASGLYGTAIGYLNGVHGEYSIGIGQGNLIFTDGSIAIGSNNDLTPTSVDATLYVMGIGNTATISNTGTIIGYSNEMYGSGSLLIGNDCWTSGNNNIIIGNDITYAGSNTIMVSGSTANMFGSSVSVSGSVSSTLASANNHKINITPSLISIYGPSGVYVSGLNIELLHNTNNKINIASTGTDIIGSRSKLYANSGSYIDVSSTGTAIIGYSGINIYTDNNNYIKTASTGIVIKATSLDLQNSQLSNISASGIVLSGPITETLVSLGNSGSSVTLNLNDGTVFTCSLTNSCVFTMPTAVAGRSFVLYLTQTSNYTATFTGVKWSGGTPPTITPSASAVDILTFISNGTYWYGTFIQNFS